MYDELLQILDFTVINHNRAEDFFIISLELDKRSEAFLMGG